ncbi:DinB family protein [Paucibacter sp. DJ1R-11]|uniref:DinB family protein n=1 Tax=Paucibacter sp. DJ1R-11 TaxID=2893556 RepID=UPI0021E3726F|nr:DinB family protein [Paucibacter sp. DJ1R-11]MCV2365187.1 DinB family protein [Paucibacter sp. DJ1R-11]
MSLLLKALEYKNWADRRTLDAVGALDPAQGATCLAFARQQLNHMVRVEENFRARLQSKPGLHSSTNTDVLPELPDLDQRLTASNAWLASYAAELRTGHMHQTLSFTFVDGLRGSMTPEEILFHIVNHGTYHRGAIGHALDLAHAKRPADTYTVFIHALEPQRRDA